MIVFHLHFWRLVLLYIWIWLLVGIFFLALWICHSTAFRTSFFQMRSQSLTASIPLHIMSYFSLAAFKIFSFSLAFSSLTTMSVSVDGFVFILHRIHQVSWICGVMLIFKIGAFFIIISSNLFSPSADFSLSSSFGTHITCILVFLMLSRSLRFSFLIQSFFSAFFILYNFYWSPSSSLILSPAILNCSWATVVIFFSFQFLYFNFQNFLLNFL